jgi:hypothetical protein
MVEKPDSHELHGAELHEAAAKLHERLAAHARSLGYFVVAMQAERARRERGRERAARSRATRREG